MKEKLTAEAFTQKLLTYKSPAGLKKYERYFPLEMPRVMLRYAIERLDKIDREKYLSKK